jgi:hypothetical protein
VFSIRALRTVRVPARADRRAATPLCLLVSGFLHVAALLSGSWVAAAPVVEFEVPDRVEIGFVDEDPGASGEPPPSAAELPPPAPAPEVVAAMPAPSEDDAVVLVDAGTAAADAGSDAGELARAETADAGPSALSGDGGAPSASGEGLGFGAGGFGSGSGGPLGAIIALHADLDRIRNTSLILETGALLEIIPEWQQLLQGSGLDALSDFSRVFVATPSLRRSQLVVSARLKGGEGALVRAVERLSQERGRAPEVRVEGGVPVRPWHDRGPTERVAGVFSSDQVVIARPEDVGRVVSVAAALARRHANQPGMEHAAGPAALLSMYENEAVALSIEGVREYVSGELAIHAPLGLRLSLRHVDEFNAELRAFGYYASADAAAAAFERMEALRRALADHPRAAYLGLRSAIDEAEFERHDAVITIETRLTMHQTRYLLGFVSRALAPRE